MKMTTLTTTALLAALALAAPAHAARGGRGEAVRPAARGDARPAGRNAAETPKPRPPETPRVNTETPKIRPNGDATRPRADKPLDPAANVDKREGNQQHRIEVGIKKGQITPDEAALLKNQETSIASLEDAFKSDGKLTKEETGKLRKALDEASLQIWAQRHDAEGVQKPAPRLGTDIVAKDELTAKIESGEMTRPQARMVLADFRKMATLKRRLGAENLTDAQRAEAQAQYDALLNKYFVQK